MMAAEPPTPETRDPRHPTRKPAIVVPNAPTWYQRLGAGLIFVVARAVVPTLRLRWDNRSGHSLEAPGGPVIYCVWHNRLALSMEIYHQQVSPRSRGKGLAVMVSASKDGAFLAAILEAFKIQPVRGSSSRRGAQALLELTSWAERGYDIAITPDGPRGPCYVVQPGVVSLAQLTGLPIVPVGFHAHRKICLRSWDRFQIPLPFSRCDLAMGKPIQVARDATDAQREEIRMYLERTLKDISVD